VFSFKQQNCLTASRHYSHNLALHTITNSLPQILSMWLNKSLLPSLKYFKTTVTYTWNKLSCLRRKSFRRSCLFCIYISAIILICFLRSRQNIFSNTVNKIHINATECAHSSYWFILKSDYWLLGTVYGSLKCISFPSAVFCRQHIQFTFRWQDAHLYFMNIYMD